MALSLSLSRVLAAVAGGALACAAQAQINQNFDTTAVGSLPAGWTSTSTGAGLVWAVKNDQSHTAPNSVFTNDVASVSSQYLTLPSIQSAGTVRIDFWKRFQTESTFDGFTVEVDINGGGFNNVGTAAFTLGAYNVAAISANFNSPIAGQPAFSGTGTTWSESIALLSTNVGDVVTVRFNMSSDSSVSSTGVWIDDVQITSSSNFGACCDSLQGTCSLNTAAACTGTGFTFQGTGSACPSVCPGQGACCDTAGVCTLRGAAGCTGTDLTFGGVGSLCTPNPCLGACCNPTTGVCTSTGSATCASPGVFQGVGVACTPSNPCPQPPPPSNDNCSDVVTANAPRVPGVGGVVNGSNVNATDDGVASCTAGHRDVYFLFTPSTSGDWKFDTCATTPSFDTMISIHSSCPADTSTQLACNDDSCGLLSSVIATNLSAGVQVIVRVGSFSAANLGGAFTLTVGQVEVGACCNALTGACATSNTGAGGCASGTTYQGQGSSCTPNPCPQPPTGACCNSTTGACTQVFASNCNGSTSTYSGDNTTCDASGFCAASGTCCSSLGNCVVRYVATCPSGLTSNAATSCTAGLCPVTTPGLCQAFDADPVGSLPANYTSSSTGAGTAWAIDSTQANSAPNAVFTNDVASVSSQFLQLPAVTAGGPLTIDFLSFYTTEATFDGWVVEFSTDGGNTWSDLVSNGTWVLNGYNQAAISVNFNSPIAGRPAFSGAGASWQEHIGTINTTAGSSVIIRFQMASDSSIASTGVWLDDICIGGIQSTATGTCCRGATCNTTVTSAAACTSSLISGQTAGAAFVTTASACNTAGNTTTPCCYANYNKVGGITVQDIFDFLNDWFAGSRYANTGGNGTPGALSVQNIFDFLNAWFAGGCS